MHVFNENFSWATFTTLMLVVIAAIVGGVVVIWGHDGALSFNQYLDALKGFAIAVGLLGIGRGVKAGIENGAAFSAPLSDRDLLADMPEPEGDGSPADEPPARPRGSAHV